MSKKSIHGVCVEFDGKGVLLLGPSGSGKSDLALRLIDGGARLVADDQVVLELEVGATKPYIVASAPTEIHGLLEIRGIGIVAVETVQISRLSLVVQLVTPDLIERLPEGASWNYLGVEIPMIMLAPFEASAAAKLRLAVRAPNMNDGAMTDNSGPTHAE